jgi:DNA-binding transcriptional MocR family regulator
MTPIQSRPPPRKPPSLKAQWVQSVAADIAVGKLKPHQAMPSVRAFAKQHGLSPFTAMEIYSQLTAQGLLEAKRGVGYFVVGVPESVPPAPTAAVPVDALWEQRQAILASAIVVDAGNGWLPADWQFSAGLKHSLRRLARSPLRLEGYGVAAGFEPLREYIKQRARRQGLALQLEQILLTQGASQALDLLTRCLLNPGDKVAIEEPAYPPTLDLLRARGVKLLAIAREPFGPDADALKRLLKQHRIKALITNTSLQNPTGSTTHVSVAKTLLALAEQRDFWIIEDEIFSDLTPTPTQTLALLDQCRRVFQVGSFSKTLLPSLRCGFIVGPSQWLAALVKLKTLSVLSSSELTERLTLDMLTQATYRRHLEQLKARLSAAQLSVQHAMAERGVEWHSRPTGGLFLYGRFKHHQATAQRWRRALNAGVLLAPGELFRVDGRADPYWRFNVATNTRLLEFVKTHLD